MPWANVANFNLTLLCTALTAAVLACALLVVEFFASRRLARQAPGALAVVLAGCALAACCLQGMAWVAAGCGSLAALLLVMWPVSFEAPRQQLTRLITPKIAWAVVLGMSMIASRFLTAHVLQSLDREPLSQSVDLEDVPVRSTLAITDKGRTIPLFHFKLHSTASEVEQFIHSNEKDLSQIIRLSEANSASNCHGWVFTGGRYGIREGDVATILIDNSYGEVTDPREGDLAIYSNGDRFSHSGLVRIADKHAPLLIESKWGPFGVYLHTVDKQPFPGSCKFYRSSRADHMLVLNRSRSAAEAVSGQLPSESSILR